jgi:hypothetical protein
MNILCIDTVLDLGLAWHSDFLRGARPYIGFCRILCGRSEEYDVIGRREIDERNEKKAKPTFHAHHHLHLVK